MKNKIIFNVFLVLFFLGISSASLEIYNHDENIPQVNLEYPEEETSGISNFSVIPHNNLTGLQGGVAGEYYHIRQSWFDELTTNLFNFLIQADTDALYSGIEWAYNQTQNSDGDWILRNNSMDFNFNESKLATIYYNATQSAAIEGTVDGGTLADTHHQDGNYDGNTFNFSEESGSPGLDFRMNFTNIEDFNAGVMRYKTSSLAGEYPVIQLWSYDDLTWHDFPIVAESESFATITQPVFDSNEHVSGGVVQMRIYKASNGNTNNHYYIDWVAISKGYGTPAGEEVDPLSIHRDGSIPLTGNWDAGDFNITTSQFIGDGSLLTGIVGGNASWNESYANDLYVDIGGDSMTGKLNIADDLNITGNMTHEGELLRIGSNLAGSSTTNISLRFGKDAPISEFRKFYDGVAISFSLSVGGIDYFTFDSGDFSLTDDILLTAGNAIYFNNSESPPFMQLSGTNLDLNNGISGNIRLNPKSDATGAVEIMTGSSTPHIWLYGTNGNITTDGILRVEGTGENYFGGNMVVLNNIKSNNSNITDNIFVGDGTQTKPAIARASRGGDSGIFFEGSTTSRMYFAIDGAQLWRFSGKDFEALDSSSQIQVPSGSEADPSFVSTSDTDTGIYYPAINSMAFSLGTSEIVRLATGGYFGVGTKSPAYKLHVTNTAGLPPTSLSIGTYTESTAGAYSVGLFSNASATVNINDIAIYAYAQDGSGNGHIGLMSNVSGAVTTNTAGYFTSAGGTNNYGIIVDKGFSGFNLTTPSHTLELGDDDAAKTTTSTWATTSDERVKKNIQPVNSSNALSFVKNFPTAITYEYNGLAGTPNDLSAIGYSAQELELYDSSMVGYSMKNLNGTFTTKKYTYNITLWRNETNPANNETISVPYEVPHTSEVQVPDLEPVRNINLHNLFINNVEAVKELNLKIESQQTEINLLKSELCKKDNTYKFCLGVIIP